MPYKDPPKRELVEIPHLVAILDEHTMPSPKNPKQLIVIDEAKLNTIADNNNRRIRETGDECPIVIGHTQDGLPEKFQPEVIGFARGFKVSPLFNTGRKAIFSRWRVYKDKLQKLLEYPRRSVELWLGKLEVDPISLLGATTPDRDLGLIRLSRANGDSVTSVFGENDMDPQQLTQMIMAQLMQSPQMQFLSALMEQVQSGEQGGGPPEEQEGPMGQEEMPPGEEGEPPMEEEPPMEPEGPPEEEPEEEPEEPVRRAAGYSSGTDTFTPSGPQRMSRQAARQPAKAPAPDLANNPLFRQLVEAVQEARDCNNYLVAKLARSERAQDLVRLQAEENIDLDLEEELSIVAPDGGDPMDNDQYQAYLGKIRKRYQRAPVNQPRIVTAAGKVHSMDSKTRAYAAAERAIEKGIKYEAALAEIDNEQ